MIDCKTKNLSQLLEVKGKLEMLKTCQQMQLASYHSKAASSETMADRYSKIKKNIEKNKNRMKEDTEMQDDDSSSDNSQHSIALYKDTFGADNNNHDDVSEYDPEGDDDEGEESDYDEEIEQIE